MPIILATWEEEIRRNEVSPGYKLSMGVHTCHPSYTGGRGRGIVILATLGKKAPACMANPRP
jgi:hypothetical protein